VRSKSTVVKFLYQARAAAVRAVLCWNDHRKPGAAATLLSPPTVFHGQVRKADDELVYRVKQYSEPSSDKRRARVDGCISCRWADSSICHTGAAAAPRYRYFGYWHRTRHGGRRSRNMAAVVQSVAQAEPTATVHNATGVALPDALSPCQARTRAAQTSGTICGRC
jgi:hypothetical protein